MQSLEIWTSFVTLKKKLDNTQDRTNANPIHGDEQAGIAHVARQIQAE